MADTRVYSPQSQKIQRIFNVWDFVALVLILSVFFILAWGAKQMATPYEIGEPLAISLDPSALPHYAVRTVIRMGIALLFSLLFTFIIGAWAAKSRRAGQLIIPAIDILQSIPVLSFLSITVVAFIHLFPGSLLGPECACIFAIFTAQAWNMTLGFYQSLRTVPDDLKEVSAMFHLSAWQRFWRIEVPFSMSSLLWNMMMSMSASWFFVVISEAISVANQKILLPGIGSYIATAIAQADMQSVFYAIFAMAIVILCYDQLIFRPLMQWSEKFKFEQVASEKTYESWVASLLLRTRLLAMMGNVINKFIDAFINFKLFNKSRKSKLTFIDLSYAKSTMSKITTWLWWLFVATLLTTSVVLLLKFILGYVQWTEITHVFLLGLATTLRVFFAIVISSLIWVPIGVWIGQRPRWVQTVQPLIQFLAAFPANLLYPLVVMLIVRYQFNVDIGVTPLMILGTQWYILFNVIAGASSIPKDLYQAADNLHLQGWQWWRRLALPGIFPFFVTGAMTAAGGAWNASIVAELVSWGDTTLRATGLGEYIAAHTQSGDFPRIALGTGMMCLFVIFLNRLLWLPLYKLAETRFKLV